MKTLKYIYLGISLFSAVTVYSQTDSTRYGGVRFGLDLLPFAGYLQTPQQKGYEITLDAEVKDGWFITAGGGSLTYDKNEVDYDYSMNGYYARIGLDHNILPRLPQENGTIFWGFRVATGSFTQQPDRITIRDGYWGDYGTSLSAQQVHPFWAELTVGIRAEVLKNLFLGWNVRGHFLLRLPKDILTPYIIPGYGNSQKNFPIGFNYMISYKIPYKLK